MIDRESCSTPQRKQKGVANECLWVDQMQHQFCHNLVFCHSVSAFSIRHQIQVVPVGVDVSIFTAEKACLFFLQMRIENVCFAHFALLTSVILVRFFCHSVGSNNKN